MYIAVPMDAHHFDKLNLDLKQFFDFANHNHVYHFHIWEGRFSLREMGARQRILRLPTDSSSSPLGLRRFANRIDQSVVPNVEQKMIELRSAKVEQEHLK